MSDTENTKSNGKAPGKMKTIKFYMNEETKPVIENDERRANSIFKEQYKKAEILVHKLIDQKEDKKNKDINNCPNNIIAFIGERGSGKTSCMMSFAKSLPTNPTYEKNSFHVLETMDPSFFEMNSNILELLIARMYNQFSEDRDEKIPYDASKNLIKAFQELQKSLQHCKKEDVHLDALEKLGHLGESERVKERLHETINCYLKCYKKDKLVISIDDIDLNVSQAYKMVEQIRKYLILPNVILLMAVKLEQLDNVIQQQMLKENEVLINRGVFAAPQVSGMAEKYLDKLIPHDARVYLPNEVSFLNQRVQLVENNDKEEDKKKDSDLILREKVPNLIYRKCRYLFYNTKGRTSLIIPRNLRELRLLLSMLNQMEDFKNNEESFYNKELFKNFFFNTWTDCLGDKKRLIAQPLINEDEPTLFNSKVVQLLYTYFFTNKEDKDKDINRRLLSSRFFIYNEATSKDSDKLLLNVPYELKDIFDTNNITYNISLGDAFAVLNYIEKRKTDKETQSLVFFIKSLYSIRLYEYYDEYTDFIKKKEETVSEVQRSEELEDYSNYQKLIGGNFYHLNDGEIIPPNKEEEERARRLINGDKLSECIKNLTGKDIENDPEALKELHLVEFFILTSSRYFQSKNRINESIPYRTIPPAYYDRNLLEPKNIYFDALAPLFNIIDIEKTYKRFTGEKDSDSDIYAIARKTKGSLLNRIYYNSDERSSENEKVYNDPEFLSRICIRNAEVIDYLEKYLKDGRKKLSTSDNKENFKIFYHSFHDFSIDTYNGKSDTEHHPILLKTFTVLGDVLKDIDDEDRFNAIFGGSSTDWSELFEDTIKKRGLKDIDEDRFNVIFGGSSTDWSKIFEDAIGKSNSKKINTFYNNLTNKVPELIELLGENYIKKALLRKSTQKNPRKNRDTLKNVFNIIVKEYEKKKASKTSQTNETSGINNTNSSTSSETNS